MFERLPIVKSAFDVGRNFRVECRPGKFFQVACDSCMKKEVPMTGRNGEIYYTYCICLTPYPKELINKCESLNKVITKYGIDREK